MHREQILYHQVLYAISSYKDLLYKDQVQQGLEIHGLEDCRPWRYTVFNWFPKHVRYTVFG